MKNNSLFVYNMSNQFFNHSETINYAILIDKIHYFGRK